MADSGWSGYTPYQYSVSGKLVVDRSWARDYFSRIGYSEEAIDIIVNEETGADNGKIQGQESHMSAVQTVEETDEEAAEASAQSSRQAAAEEFCRKYFTQWTYADGAVNYFAENSRDAAQTSLAEGSQALNDFQSQNMDSPLFLDAACFLEDVRSTTEDGYTFKVSITYIATQNDPAYFTWEELQNGRFTSVFYITVDDNNQITDVYYGDDGGTFPAGETSESAESSAVSTGIYTYQNESYISDFTITESDGAMSASLMFWHDYGSSSSDEEFFFPWENGTWEYKVTGNRSGQEFDLQFSQTDDGLMILVYPVSGSCVYWETGMMSDMWSGGEYVFQASSDMNVQGNPEEGDIEEGDAGGYVVTLSGADGYSDAQYEMEGYDYSLLTKTGTKTGVYQPGETVSIDITDSDGLGYVIYLNDDYSNGIEGFGSGMVSFTMPETDVYVSVNYYSG